MKAFKYWFHKISLALLIICAVVFAVPFVCTVVNFFFPVTSTDLGSAGQKALASLSVLLYGLSQVPMLSQAFIVLTTGVNVFDIVWRKKRGHRHFSRQLIYTIIVLVVSVVGILSQQYIINVYTYTPATL